ncbi:MAG: hypothetical protein P8H13_10390 [Polaribacter sp.]|nr:hypothetical protein [Polaribacter sp.]MDG1812330.1 hypothetical protein [Polaribacter sp.]MDG1993187.1 hypothetical protein [Polaribacter sp.]
MNKTTFLLLTFCVISVSFSQKNSLRKYKHVKTFYKGISKKATELCLKNNIPPAALLAISGLESGWDTGYIGQITGNILSLGLRKGDMELPALRLPRLIKTNKILFDSIEILNYSESELKWENRPESLKKDYRPKNIAGTTYQLGYFKNNPKEKAKAQLANINDFVTVFIGRKSKLKAYRDVRKKMDSLVTKHGKKILLSEKTAIDFINEIGGKPNTFNYRASWPKKVIYIIKKAGLSQLSKELNAGKSFEESWTSTN